MAENQDVVVLTTKPARDLARIMTAKLPELMAVAASNVKADPNWLARAQLEIMIKPETAKLMERPKGLETACYAIMRAATVGINFGGTKPQAYFVPSGEGVRLDISQFGYAQAAVYGPGAVLSHIPELIKVYQNDGVRMNQAEGTIIFPPEGIDPFKDRGALMGYMMRLEFKDGRQAQVHAIAQTKVIEIGKKYGQQAGPAYQKSPEEMHEKIAVKQLLKRAYAESEGNAQNALDMLDDEPAPTVIKDRDERLARQMGNAATAMKPAEKVAEQEPEVQDDPEPEPESKASDGAEKDKDELF